MPAAYLVLTTVVADPADRAPFDHWYRTERLPDALKAFDAVSAMRGWSTRDPSVHTAFYRFASADVARAVGEGAAIKALVGEFNRLWGSRVVLSRDVLPIADELEGTTHHE